jgi:hypothetical protein
MRLFRAPGRTWSCATAVVFGGYLALVSPVGASEPAKPGGWYKGWGSGPIDLAMVHIGRPIPGPPPLLPLPQPRKPTPSETAGGPYMS